MTELLEMLSNKDKEFDLVLTWVDDFAFHLIIMEPGQGENSHGDICDL